MYKCNKCTKIFARKSNLENHKFKIFPCKSIIEPEKIVVKIVEENKDEDEIICTYCNKTFSTKFNLNKHHKGHCKIKKEKEKFDTEIIIKLKELFQEHVVNNNITNNNITNICVFSIVS